MANDRHEPATGGDAEAATAPGTPPRAPRWVKVSAIIVGILILLFVIANLIGLGGEHGPGRHSDAGDAPAISVMAVQTAAG